MPNWIQLLTDSSEYTPGPWDVWLTDSTGAAVVMGPRPVGYESRIPKAIALMARIEEPEDDVNYRIAGDREAFANAKLMSDAVAMIELLAKWVAFAEMTLSGKRESAYLIPGLLEGSETLLRNHVRMIPIDTIDNGNALDMVAKWDEAIRDARQKFHEDRNGQ